MEAVKADARSARNWALAQAAHVATALAVAAPGAMAHAAAHQDATARAPSAIAEARRLRSMA